MFEESHESLEDLRRLFSGQAAPGEAERAAAHLAGCRECWLLGNRAITAQKESGALALRGPMRALIDLHEAEQAHLEEWLEAQAKWIELRSLSTKARREKVRLTRSLHTTSFLEVLHSEGTTAPPAEKEEHFYLALLVVEQLPSAQFPVELRSDLGAECCAAIADARRRQAKWAAARDALKKGSQYAERGSRNGVAKGRILIVAGSLEDDLGNTAEAVKLLRQAAGLFETSGQIFLRSWVLAKLAYTLLEHDPAEALRAIDQALTSIPANHPRLAMFAEGIKIDCLLLLGAPQEALLRFHRLKGLHEQFREPFVQLRRRFSAALILEHLGRPNQAESLFQEVIAGDLEHGLVRDFFLDLGYLFGFYLRSGKKAEAIAVCRRARQELGLLDDEEGSDTAAREQMREVWRSLEEEVKKGTVDLGAPTVLKKYIKAHWRIPADDPPFLKE